MRKSLVAAMFAGLAGLATAGLAENSNLNALDKYYEAQGWEAVGRLELGNRGSFCTATLISPNVLLSAAHCVFDEKGRMRQPEEIQFRAGLRNGEAAATRKIVNFVAHEKYDPNRNLDHHNASHDVALLELAQPIPTHQVNPFILHSGAVGPGEVSVVSYGQGRENLPSRQKSCNLTHRDRGSLLLFDCDVTYGSSGAPVFSHLNGRGRILSVISGMTTTRDGEFVSVGPHLPELVSELKQELRARAVAPVAQVRRITVGGGARSSGAKFVKAN